MRFFSWWSRFIFVRKKDGEGGFRVVESGGIVPLSVTGGSYVNDGKHSFPPTASKCSDKTTHDEGTLRVTSGKSNQQ